MPEEKDPIVAEEEQLKAQLDAAKRAEQPPPPEEAAAAEPIPPAETPPAETPPAAAAPAETPPKPAEEPPKRDGAAWKLLRQRERELEEARAELARRTQTNEPAKEPDFENQPADYLKARNEQTAAELAQVKQQIAYRDTIDAIKAEEAQFEQTHPDYRKAADFLIDKEVKRWQRVGLETMHVRNVLGNARSGNPQFAQLAQNVRALANNPQVIAEADKTGRDPEEQAAWFIARQSHIEMRRAELVQAARSAGKSVAEAAYDEAVDWGWNGNPQDGTRETAARARVAQAQEVAAATHSLSESATAEQTPEVRVLRSRQQVLDLDDAGLDALIKSGNYRQL